MIVEMTQSYTETTPGSKIAYAVGDRYLLDKKKAEEFIALGVAIDPDNPPLPEVEEEAEEDATDEHTDSDH